jgi:uncharacterized Tic20 family protein
MKREAHNLHNKGGYKFHQSRNFVISVIIIVSIIIFLLLTVIVLSQVEPRIKIFPAFILLLIYAGIMLYIYLKLKMVKIYPNGLNEASALERERQSGFAPGNIWSHVAIS